MKNRLKDPRPKLMFFGKLSLITFFLLPFLYFSLKSQKIGNLLLFAVGFLIIFLIVRKYFKKKDEEVLPGVIPTGFMFSGLLFFIATIIFKAILRDYLTKQIVFPSIALIAIFVLLLFSLGLLYLSIRSRKYEKEILKIKSKNYIFIFIIFIILSLMVILPIFI